MTMGEALHRKACRAHTPNEKRAVIEKLYAAWIAMPELRLGQLITNAVLPGSGEATAPLYFIEDTIIGGVVDKFAADHGRKPR